MVDEKFAEKFGWRVYCRILVNKIILCMDEPRFFLKTGDEESEKNPAVYQKIRLFLDAYVAGDLRDLDPLGVIEKAFTRAHRKVYKDVSKKELARLIMINLQLIERDFHSKAHKDLDKTKVFFLALQDVLTRPILTVRSQ
ncbi:MAG: hypothetical protein NUV49_01435 [Patescibacteria group bacterium]|nr:hypothetical protein [Patescibacteria group bacterium]